MKSAPCHNRIQQYLDIAGVIIITIRADQTVEYINKKGCELLGYSKEEIEDKNWFDLFVPVNARQELKKLFDSVIQGKHTFKDTYESSILTRNGEIRLIQWSNSCVRNEHGVITTSISSGEDITEKRKREAFINTLNEQISDVVLINNPKGIITYVSPSLNKVLGYKAEDVLGRNMLDFVHRDDQQEVVQLYHKLLSHSTGSFFYKHRVRTIANNYIWIEGESRNLLNDPNIGGIVSNFRNISERISLEERFKILFELSPDALLLVDDKGIIDCNNASLKMLSCKNKNELLGQSPYFYSPKYQPDGKLSLKKSKEMNEIATRQGYHSFDWLHKNFNGGVFPVEVSIIPLEKLGKNISLIRWHNIMQRKRFELELLMAKSEAEATSKAQEEFLSTMSHEIRTPLNAVIGLSHILLEENPRKDQIENLKTLKFASQNLLSLINDILDYNKIQSGKIKLEQIDINLEQLITGLLKSAQPKAEEKKIQLQFSKKGDIPEVVIGDPTRLSQVLNNLLSNAVKFTRKGSVAVEVSLAGDYEKEVDIKFEIKDTGIGIPKEKLATIFEQFTQANSATTRKYGGTGLGLSITKKLLELMGAQILVSSTEGIGSIFYYTLRFEKKKSQPQKAAEVLPISESLEHLNLSILLVEDNEINQMVVSKFIRKWGIEVDIAGHGEIGIKKAKAKNYNLILMDLQMPDIDGFTTTMRIREDGYTGPIVALTAEVLFDVKDKVLRAGMNDIVGKPFKPQYLFEKIKYYCTKESVAA